MKKETEDVIYSKPITTINLIKFALPTTIRMIFISMYTTVDGIVVSNFVGSAGLSAINIVFPVLNVSMAMAFMFAMGSNAIIGKRLGEGRNDEASSFMTLTVLLTVMLSVLFTLIFFGFDEKIYMLLGSDEMLLPYCVEYGTVMVLAGPVWTLQVLFQSYLVTADRAHLGMWLSVSAGILNIILDILLVGVLEMGLTGAALASAAGMVVGGLYPLRIFFGKKTLIHFEKPRWEGKTVLKSMGNGTSEMVSSMASAIVTTLFNLQMMSIAGEKGVAAISAVLYLQFMFVTIFVGFSNGTAPVVSYNYGAQNRDNIRKIYKISIHVIGWSSVLMLVLSELLTRPLTMIFASEDPKLAELMISGFRIIAVSFLFSGIGIFASSFFTALSNGVVSALISFLRTFAAEAGALILLPMRFGIDGVWWAMPVAEIISAVLAVILLAKYKKTYGYQ